MSHWTSVVLRGTVYVMMLILSCGLLFGCQEREDADQGVAAYESTLQ